MTCPPRNFHAYHSLYWYVHSSEWSTHSNGTYMIRGLQTLRAYSSGVAHPCLINALILKWTVFGDSSLKLWWFALHPCQPLCVLPLCVLDSFHQLIKYGAILIKHNRFAHLIWCELKFFHELLIHCVVNKCVVWHRVKQIKVSCSS